MAQTYEFASPEWFEALRATIERHARAAGDGLEGVHWSICEVFTNVPPHLARMSDGKVAWHCRFRGGEIEFGLGEIDDAAVKITGDYATVRPLACMEHGDDPTIQTRLNEMLTSAVREGKMHIDGSLDTRPTALAGVHDEMARITV